MLNMVVSWIKIFEGRWWGTILLVLINLFKLELVYLKGLNNLAWALLLFWLFLLSFSLFLVGRLFFIMYDVLLSFSYTAGEHNELFKLFLGFLGIK